MCYVNHYFVQLHAHIVNIMKYSLCIYGEQIGIFNFCRKFAVPIIPSELQLLIEGPTMDI
jgi:hypothetical protein